MRKRRELGALLRRADRIETGFGTGLANRSAHQVSRSLNGFVRALTLYSGPSTRPEQSGSGIDCRPTLPGTLPLPLPAPTPRFAITLASITLIGPLSIHLFLPLMPAVQRDFGISSATVGMTFTVTLFAMAFATLVYGSLSDRLGRRPVLLAGLALFLAGSALCALAGSVVALILGRLLQAIGAGAGLTLSRAMARDAYGPEGLVKVIAYITMGYTLGPMVAPFIGGILVDRFGWRSAFGVALLAGIVVTIAVVAILHETLPHANRVKHAIPLVSSYFQLLRQPIFDSFILQTGFSTGVFLSMAAASSFLMKDYLGRSATEFGAYFILFPIGFLLGNFISSRLTKRVSIETMVLAGSILTTLTIATQSAFVLAGIVVPLTIFIPGFLITLSQGIAMPNAQAGAIRVNAHLAGTAAGLGVFAQMFIGAVFVQFYATIADGTPIPMVITTAITPTPAPLLNR